VAARRYEGVPVWLKYATFVFTAMVLAAFAAGWFRCGPAATGGVMACAAIFAVGAAHKLFVARPLERILAGAQRFATGDHEHRIQMRGRDELARVAATLNEMAARLGAATEHLESQVAERTEDLRAVLAEVHERSRIAEEVNEKLAQADRRRSRFLTNVSHDLRTPLNSILGYLKLLLDGVYESEDEAREFLENASMSATHLLHMVRDVLTMTQVEEGMLQVRGVALHAGALIHEALRMLEVDRRARGLTLRFEAEGGLLVWADAGRVRQVLVNLVGNALKFTTRGEIVVRAAAVADVVRFEVEDSGRGIPPSELEAIFERFHQVPDADADWSGGTGLGLSICRDLVMSMQGEIGATSRGVGHGATFWFTLPAVPAAAAV